MTVALDDNEPDYGTFGVRAQRVADISPPAVDRQRVYQSDGGNISVAAKTRTKAAASATVNNAKPGTFGVRKRTLRKG